ncbi:MAG: monofunctional biosynthetic peptidoglycan transglycosylase [Bilophila wadsworthia]
MLFGVTLFLMLDIGRYLVWPPVGWLETEQPRTTSFMEYRQEQWQDGPRAKDAAMRPAVGSAQAHCSALRQAVVTSEDDLFWKHDGFNFSQMYDALKRNWDKGRMAAGGSTISQQLAKNLWFTPERSILRKIKEAIMTWRLELALDKERILELYLNVAEWGNGVYGAEAAARHYFGKSAANLSRGEAARLAVMLPSPLRRTPSSAIVKRLSSRLLKRMPR